MKLTLNVKPQTLNVYRTKHWRVQGKEKKEFAKIVWLECLAQNIKPIKEYPVRMEYIFHFKDKRSRDLDNLIINVKYINDALIECNILEEDNYNYINEIKIKAVKSEEEKIEIYAK